MVKQLLFFFILTTTVMNYNVYSQNDIKDYWWYRTKENKIFETNYRFAISDISDSTLKKEIRSYIKSNIDKTIKEKEEIAIMVNLLSIDKGENYYRISYLPPNYFNFFNSKSSIQQLGLVENRIIFIKIHQLEEIKLKKEVLYGLLRDRFSDICEKNNKTYKVDNSIDVVLITEHQIPHWYIKIKNGKLLHKEIRNE
jgi:hypothetical protein